MNYFQYNIHGLFYLSAGLFCLAMGIFVVVKNPRSPLVRAFSLFTLSTSVWILCFGMVNLVRHPDKVYFWISGAYCFGISFISVFTYAFSLRLRGVVANTPMLTLGYVTAFLLAVPMVFFSREIALFTSFSWGRYPGWQLYPLALIHYGLVCAHFLGFSFLAFLNFYGHWKTADTWDERKTGRFIFFVFLVAYIGTADFLTALGIKIYPVGYLALTFFAAGMFYSVVRHQIFDVRMALKKLSLIAAIYAILFLFLVPLTPCLLANKKLYLLLPRFYSGLFCRWARLFMRLLFIKVIG
jgi:hypothetical protein